MKIENHILKSNTKNDNKLSFTFNDDSKLWNIDNVTNEQKELFETVLNENDKIIKSVEGDAIRISGIPEIGTKVNPQYNPNKLETYFNYEIAENFGIILYLKSELDKIVLLKWEGFSIEYNCFKLWGDLFKFGKGYMLMCNTENSKCREIVWGTDRSMVLDSVWAVRNSLLKCAHEIFPDLPSLKEYKELKGVYS